VSALAIGVFLDPAGESWRAMDVCGEMLVREWRAMNSQVSATPLTIDLPRVVRRSPLPPSLAFNVDRIAGRFVTYPAYAARQRGRFDFFHVIDHSYAQIVHVLPRKRTGVFCHDLDAFRSIVDPARESRGAAFRAMQSIALRGLKSAAVVFYTTNLVREEIERAQLVPSSRLVQAPYGVSSGLDAIERDDAEARAILAPLQGRPFLLHVGSAIARKRLDVLFETFARLRPHFPELRLVQAGADLSAEQRAHATRCGLDGVLLQPAKRIERMDVLGGIYRRAKALLVTSDSEGFGIPVIEGLACGTVVFSSDIPVLREVGGGVVVHCRVGDPEDWASTLRAYLDGKLAVPPREQRLARASMYTWAKQARTILDAYRALPNSL
jgi:glycosyltransferase involved in cell wall biosynthesis